jgi:hypothetical protein
MCMYASVVAWMSRCPSAAQSTSDYSDGHSCPNVAMISKSPAGCVFLTSLGESQYIDSRCPREANKKAIELHV